LKEFVGVVWVSSDFHLDLPKIFQIGFAKEFVMMNSDLGLQEEPRVGN
jgi:hypothetical protein